MLSPAAGSNKRKGKVIIIDRPGMRLLSYLWLYLEYMIIISNSKKNKDRSSKGYPFVM